MNSLSIARVVLQSDYTSTIFLVLKHQIGYSGTQQQNNQSEIEDLPSQLSSEFESQSQLNVVIQPKTI
jgi:hypothetical protein